MGRQLIQRLVQREQLFIVHLCREFEALNIYPLRAAAMPEIIFTARIINQDTAHRLGGSGEEVGAIPPFGLIIAAKSQPGFVNECGGLQGLTGIFARHFYRRQLAQLFIHEWQQFVRRLWIALIHALQNDREFAHTTEVSGFGWWIEAQNW